MSAKINATIATGLFAALLSAAVMTEGRWWLLLIGWFSLLLAIGCFLAFCSSAPQSDDTTPEVPANDVADICNKPLEEGLALLFDDELAGFDDPIVVEDLEVRYRQLPSTSMKLDRKQVVLSRISDRNIVAIAEVMNVDTGCYWDWASATKLLSTSDDSECDLDSIFQNTELQAIFPKYAHFAFLGVASKPGTQNIDYLQLTQYRADNLLLAAARTIPEQLRNKSVPLVLALGRNNSNRQRGSDAEKLERSAYLVGVRQCITGYGDARLVGAIVNSASLSEVKFSDYSHSSGMILTEETKYDPNAQYKEWTRMNPPEDPE